MIGLNKYLTWLNFARQTACHTAVWLAETKSINPKSVNSAISPVQKRESGYQTEPSHMKIMKVQVFARSAGRLKEIRNTKVLFSSCNAKMCRIMLPVFQATQSLSDQKPSENTVRAIRTENFIHHVKWNLKSPDLFTSSYFNKNLSTAKNSWDENTHQ